MISQNITKVAVVSDTHSHLDPRIADIVRECDIAVHAGDICGAEVLEAMQPKSGKVVAVTGNNDPYCHPNGSDLPAILSFTVAGETITVEHGHKHGAHKPSHDSLRYMHSDAKVIIYGHTHKQVIDKDATPWVINPGAAGQTRTHGGPSCLVLECETGKEWQIKTYRFSEV
ncbi:metallophosphoesterase family protein [Cocleimonas flava]|uniref:Phosphoesterase n=1 Tax=Cocleimonas flava TaxID=634765 RepID=A0A4R1ESW3_9GAMM|nr:metallophosphoesterase family protein [Cocleimonas flava]TCJ83012.1 hypothetical protein EV695_3750 [Cocleimonas flava]